MAELSSSQKAVQDVLGGIRNRRLWITLALHDIRLRYRGSLLGPFWLTISTGIMVGAMGWLYPALFNISTANYLPFVATGMVLWQYISGQINDACATFTSSYGIIHQVRMPQSTWVFRCALRNLLIFAHSAVIIPIALLATHLTPSLGSIWRVPAGFLILVVDGIWVSLLLGMLGARFRDVPPIVTNFLQVAFFLTPIFWTIPHLGKLAFLVTYNPLFAVVDIVRSPLLDQATQPTSWPVAIATAVIGMAVTFRIFTRYRFRIPFWV